MSPRLSYILHGGGSGRLFVTPNLTTHWKIINATTMNHYERIVLPCKRYTRRLCLRTKSLVLRSPSLGDCLPYRLIYLRICCKISGNLARFRVFCCCSISVV